jgi:hypothetical protein
MPEPTRLDRELADVLALTQTVRSAAKAARELVESGKLRKRLFLLDQDLAELQERVNERVVSSAGTRGRLTGRSRRLRDAEQAAQAERLADADVLDALQALVAEAAYAVAQWLVVRRLAKAEGDKAVRKLAKRALPVAEAHFALALEAVDKTAKRS